MITFIFLTAIAVVAVFLIALAYGANQRKRAGQSGITEAVRQEKGPTPRATGVD